MNQKSEVRRTGSIWSSLFGQRLPSPPADALRQRIGAWRVARQPALVRLERNLAQSQAALQKTKLEIEMLIANPIHVQATAPNTGSELVDQFRARHELLVRREEGLRTMCWQLQGHLQAAKEQAESLANRQVRSQRLLAMLGRCRCVYEVRHTFSSPVLGFASLAS